MQNQFRARAGFTLVELLVVIAIIALLASLLLPAVHRVKVATQKAQAALDIGQIVTAIHDYETAYGRLPTSANAVNSALGTGGDFTYGTFGTASIRDTSGAAASVDDSNGAYHANNSEVMAQLLALEHFGNGQPTVNLGNVKNTLRTLFLHAKFASDTASPGIGRDGVYRDPWGDPYIITFDLNGDGKARDALYAVPAVSEDANAATTPPPGLNGLIRSVSAPTYFEANSDVMVWSAGPDRAIDPSGKANRGANKDNVLSWK